VKQGSGATGITGIKDRAELDKTVQQMPSVSVESRRLSSL
jgi:hypothetical protein